jgi:hypothetical protein
MPDLLTVPGMFWLLSAGFVGVLAWLWVWDRLVEWRQGRGWIARRRALFVSTQSRDVGFSAR